jgi:hypothetical protein
MSKETELIEQVQEPVEETIERPYTLRKLKDSDLFPILNIFRKVGLKEFKDAFSQVVDGKSVDEIGFSVLFEMATIVISNFPSAEAEIYALCSSLSGIQEEEISEMEFGTVPLMIYDAFSEVKNTAFFKVLSKLL